MALAILTAGADITSLAISISDLTKTSDAQSQTVVQLGIGGSNPADPSNDLGGNVPHIAIWDKSGTRIGQHSPSSHDHMKPNTDNSFTISNKQNPHPDQVQPEYLMLSMNDDNAICLSYVFATGNSAQWTWFGDMGYKCGADWYNSDYIVGDGTYTPKCVWLDYNHSDNLRFNGLSLHMPDFAADEQGKVSEYQNNLDTLCKSKPRMNFWNQILPDNWIPFHNWQYNDDGSDQDPASVIDKPGSKTRRDQQKSRANKRTTSNPSPEHLVVSGRPGHSAKELCESETSYGADFVSTVEGIYCDMEVKQAWPLCNATITTSCFDMTSRSVLGGTPNVHVRDSTSGGDIPSKSYKTFETWGGATLP